LRNIVLDEISLVDVGANPHAVVTLIKSAGADEAPRKRVVIWKRDGDDKEHHHMDIIKIAGREVTSFDDAVDAICAAERVPRHRAMTKARTEFESLYKSYQREGEVAAAERAEAVAKQTQVSNDVLAARARYDDAIESLMRHSNMTRARAASELRRRDPSLHRTRFGDA
jgi:hypothetical protein